MTDKKDENNPRILETTTLGLTVKFPPDIEITIDRDDYDFFSKLFGLDEKKEKDETENENQRKKSSSPQNKSKQNKTKKSTNHPKQPKPKK